MTSYDSQAYGRGPDGFPCPLCGATTYAGNACTACFLPSKVMESIRYRPDSPRFLGVLGTSGVGKTVYLGMLLDLLARGACGLHGLAQGAFTLNLQRKLVLALERQRFPEKTPVESDRWDWVHCEVRAGKGKTLFEIVAPDVAGEAVVGELESQGTYKTICALIARCAGLAILVDIVQVVADSKAQELFAMQLISYLDAIRPRKRRRKIDAPVAIVFTKTDLCDEPLRAPEDFARANTPALHSQCVARLDRCSFHFSGVAGSVGRLIDRNGQESLVPLRIEPRGVVEPFAWMVGQLR
jgi:hypothetical protein